MNISNDQEFIYDKQFVELILLLSLSQEKLLRKYQVFVLFNKMERNEQIKIRFWNQQKQFFFLSWIKIIRPVVVTRIFQTKIVGICFFYNGIYCSQVKWFGVIPLEQLFLEMYGCMGQVRITPNRFTWER